MNNTEMEGDSNLSAFMNDASCYEATQIQQEEIEKEIRACQPLISAPLDLDTLESDFSGHDIYLQKLQILKKKYTKMRRLRRDGNCFYRAFGFGYAEYLIKKNDQVLIDKFRALCTECKDYLLSIGYTQFTVEDFCEQFLSLIDTVTESKNLDELSELFNEQGHSDYYVVFLRLIVSSYLQKNEEDYKYFVDQGLTMKQFCETEVEPMNRESDNLHMLALSQALDVPICVENCQISGSLTTIHIPDTNPPPISSPVTLFYRPGHYDILYK